jgi:hypothetical protein
MRHIAVDVWVVYQMPMRGCPDGIRAVCEQKEWELMDHAKPGYYTLIQSGIANEGEAEQLARGASGADRPRGTGRRLRSWPGEATAISPDNDPPATA